MQVNQVQVHGLLMVQVRRASGLTFMPITSIRVGSENARPRLWGFWFIYKLPTLPALINQICRPVPPICTEMLALRTNNAER